jgi:nucleotide-binding universal stress UspA family protein
MKLLVAIDLSDDMDTVVTKARELAAALAARVWLVHVADPEPAFVGYDVGPQYERDAMAEKFRKEHAALQAIANAWRAGGLDTTALLVQGATVETLLKEAADLQADMIIAGSHGKGAMRRLLVGSVSEGLLQNTQCPILIVPTHTSA